MNIPAHVNGWDAYLVTIQHGRKVYTWTRFAPDAIALIVGVQEACRAEGWETAKITDWRRL